MGVRVPRGHGQSVRRQPHYLWRDFGGDERLWAADTAAKLKAWGFNLLGPGANTNLLKRGFAYTRQLPMGAKFIAKDDPDTKLATYMPNMFSPKFPAYCSSTRRRRFPRRTVRGRP